MANNINNLSEIAPLPLLSDNPMAAVRQMQNETDRVLKELFRKDIRGSFLIKIRYMVAQAIGVELFNYYRLDMLFNTSTVVTGRDETPEFDIARIIVGCHKHHSVFLNATEIRANEKSETYQKMLVSEVVEKIRLHQFGSIFFRKKQLLLGDEFLYFPVPYELFCLCMQSLLLINGKSDPMLIYYSDIINLALSALTQLENNLLSNAYPLCRGMIELFLKTEMLKLYPEAMTEYTTFSNYEIHQTCVEQEYQDEFLERFNNRKVQSCKSKVDYLHYGWLDYIDDYNGRYSLYGILNFLYDRADDTDTEILKHMERLYKMCHGYTHGSAVHVKYPLLQYFEISTILYFVLRKNFLSIAEICNEQLPPESENLIQMLDRDWGTLANQYNIRSTENFELYYSIYGYRT